MNKSNILNVFLGIALAGTTGFCIFQHKRMKEVVDENDRLREVLDLNRPETTEHEETPKPVFVQPVISEEDIQHASVVEEQVYNIANNLNVEREKRVKFLNSLSDDKQEETDESKYIDITTPEGEEMKMDPNSPQAFSVYVDSLMYPFVQEASRPDSEAYREWTRQEFNLERFATEDIQTQEVIKQLYDMFDYYIYDEYVSDVDYSRRQQIVEQLEDYFGEDSTNVELVSYGNFIVRTIQDIVEDYEDISLIELAAVMLNQIDVFDPDTAAKDKMNAIREVFEHRRVTGIGYGVFGFNTQAQGANGLYDEVNMMKSHLYDAYYKDGFDE